MAKRVNLILVLFFAICDFGVLSERISEKICRETYSSIKNTSTSHTSDSQKDLGLGKVSTVPGEFPYMAALGWKNEKGKYNFLFGGTLIGPQYVLTAAHCTKNYEGEPAQFVRIGGGNLLDSTVENIAITDIYRHPNYNGTHYNDIAILKLASPSSQPPACLWQTPEINKSEVTAIGYGVTSVVDVSPSKDLLKVNLKIVPNDECAKHFEPTRKLKEGIIDSHFCFGTEKNKDTCAGDSGGPAVVKVKDHDKEVPYVAGVISFGRSCGDGSPTGSIRVSSYLDWIESVMSK